MSSRRIDSVRSAVWHTLWSLPRAALALLSCAGVACDDDCDTQCHYAHDDCLSEQGDDAEKQRCAAERDQCIGICASQPVDTDFEE